MFITAAIILLVLAFAVPLLVRAEDLPVVAPPSPTLYLDERRATIYENLRDLQNEYRMNKLSDEDYQSTKQDLQKELAGVMAQIEKVKAAGESTSSRSRTCRRTCRCSPRSVRDRTGRRGQGIPRGSPGQLRRSVLRRQKE